MRAVTRAVISACALAVYAVLIALSAVGMEIAARMTMMPIAISNSTSVKSCLFMAVCL